MSTKDYLSSLISTLKGLNADAKSADEDFAKLVNDPNFCLTQDNKEEIRNLLAALEATLTPVVKAVEK